MWNKKRRLCDAVVLLLAFLFLALWVEPNLVYHSFGTLVAEDSAFLMGWPFLWDSLALPGGAVSYVAGFLSQGFYESWLGAGIVTLAAGGLLVLSRWHMAHAGARQSQVLAYLAPLLILMTYARYQHPLAECLAVSLGLLFSLVFEAVSWPRPVLRVGLYVLMAIAADILAGAGGLWVFSLMTVIYRGLGRRHWILAAAALPVAAVIVRLAADWPFQLSPDRAALVLTPFSPQITRLMKTVPWVWIVLLYVLVPVTVLILACWDRIRPKALQTSVNTAARPPGGRRSGPAPAARLAGLVLPGLVIAASGAGLYWSCDRMNKQFVVINALSRQARWPEVLAAARRLPRDTWNVFCNHDVNRALFHTGRLGYEMFSYAQDPRALLLSDQDIGSSLAVLKLCDLYTEIGNVNAAEKLGSEFLSVAGPYGVILERLAWIHVLKGELDTARVYLHALQQDPTWSVTARALLKELDVGLAPIRRAGLERRRRSMLAGGLFAADFEATLARLLDQDPGNRMAFEYLMASYLLTGQLEKAAARLGRLASLGYQDIPIHYEEALLLYYGLQGRMREADAWPIRAATRQRFSEFARLNNALETGDRQAILGQLHQNFGASYFLYYRLHR